MRIVHVCIGSLPPLLSPLGGAIQRRVVELSMAQARRGHEVEAFSIARRGGTRVVDGVTFHYIPVRMSGPGRHIEYQLRILKRLLTIRPRPDVLNFHSEPEGSVVGRVLRIPSVLFYDNYLFRRGALRRTYRGLLGAFDALLPCSEYCAHSSREHWHLPTDRMSVIHNGVNTGQFAPDSEGGARERARHGIDGKVVLYVGRVCEQKGSDLLLDAFGLVSQDVPGAQLLIAGPIADFDPARARQEAIPWERRIKEVGGTYLGVVHESRLAATYNMADVFVMPTRELEMFGMAAAEAQACGVPTVASDHGGLREVVPPECGGRFPVGDSRLLAAELRRLLTDDDERARAGHAALENGRRFDWDRIARDMDEVYERIL